MNTRSDSYVGGYVDEAEDKLENNVEAKTEYNPEYRAENKWDYCIILLGNSELDARVFYKRQLKPADMW